MRAPARPAADAAPGAAPGSTLRPDAPGAVRAGEELDGAALAAWLARAVPGLAHAAPELVTVEQFGHGFSNLTYLVRVGGAGADAPPVELVLRRPPFGVRAGSAHDVGREYRLLAALHPTYGRVPRPVAFTDDAAVLGAPFYVMERVRGVILRGAPGEPVPDAATLAALAERFVAELAALHALDWRRAGLGALGRPEGYVERQVSGWTRRWQAARTADVPAIERTARWLADQRPPEGAAEGGASLIHNDFKYDNLVLDPADPTRVLAVLDWEMATIGDPLMDLGTSLGYWVDPDDPPALQALGLGLTARPGSPTRAALVARYGAATGRDVSRAPYYFVFGLFKLAVVAQQIHARWVQGHTRDPRFARLDAAVRALGGMAERVMEAGRVSGLG